ncbi:MAG: ABC transporter permease, partial [Pseudomonadota bacterium]|nr:ABC transporter permease [Pseudomonadota bacterium]
MDGPQDTFLGFRITPLNRRRIENFKANKRGYWSFWVFIGIFVLSLFAELIANDKPLLIYFEGAFYSPVVTVYPETAFGGDFETEADYSDPYLIELIKKGGWMIKPIIPYSFDT